MRKLCISLLFGLVFSLAAMAYAESAQKNVAQSVLRLHIIANSDSDADQSVKLKVRDKIISEMSEILNDADNIKDAKQIVDENLGFIEKCAKEVLLENGFEYGAKATRCVVDFPAKKYANICLPAGDYDALRVILGDGSGKNWWCVMYPPLCFSTDALGLASPKSTEKLEKSISEGNYSLISSDGKMPVEFKLKIFEIFDFLGK